MQYMNRQHKPIIEVATAHLDAGHSEKHAADVIVALIDTSAKGFNAWVREVVADVFAVEKRLVLIAHRDDLDLYSGSLAEAVRDLRNADNKRASLSEYADAVRRLRTIAGVQS